MWITKFIVENMTENKKTKVKTTILIDKTLKKLARVFAIQNDMTFGELVEKALEEKLVTDS
ncbi:MAG: hypothetical protein ABIA11_00840 [Patescibacteria group bacterium]|nr:hypothetical protein [Patescibacteria group bacterium]